MPPPGASWPPILRFSTTSPPERKARLMNVHNDTTALLGHIKGHTNLRIAAAISDHLKNVEELTKDLLLNPLHDLSAQFAKINNQNLEMQKDLAAVKAFQERQLGPSRMGTASWASGTRHAPAPAHHLSPPGSHASSAAASPPELQADREVIVRLNDASIASKYRSMSIEKLTDHAEQIRKRLADGSLTRTESASMSAPLASVTILASRQLKSGDLRFTVQNARQAEILRVHGRDWAKGFYKKAELLLPTWGIVVHDIQVRSLGVDTPRNDDLARAEVQRRVIGLLEAGNRKDWGDAKITRITWLIPPRGKTGSLVCEFLSPIPANIAIDRGVLWKGNCLSATLYDRAIRLRQCHTCQKWGHIGTTCPNKVKCVHCAGGHPSRECPAKADGTLVNKCVNCGDAHAAWASVCPTRVAETERLAELARYRPRYHPVPAYFSVSAPSVSAAPSTVSSWGTKPQGSSSEGTSSSEGSDSAAPSSSNRERPVTETETDSDSDAMQIDDPNVGPTLSQNETNVGPALSQTQLTPPSRSATGLQKSIHAPRTKKVPKTKKTSSKSATGPNDAPLGTRRAIQPKNPLMQPIDTPSWATDSSDQPTAPPSGPIFTNLPTVLTAFASTREARQFNSDPTVQTPSISTGSTASKPSTATRKSSRQIARIARIEASKKKQKDNIPMPEGDTTFEEEAYDQAMELNADMVLNAAQMTETAAKSAAKTTTKPTTKPTKNTTKTTRKTRSEPSIRTGEKRPLDTTDDNPFLTENTQNSRVFGRKTPRRYGRSNTTKIMNQPTTLNQNDE